MNRHVSRKTHCDKDPYLRPEMWADGTLVFWNNGNHRREAYRDFEQRMVKEAVKLNKA